MKIKPFIFNWNGQYQNTLLLENQLKDLNPIIINSDDNNTLEHWVNIGNECYFSDQFRKALELFDDSEYDFLWHIQADASYDNWQEILDSAKKTFEKYNWGVYAPNVNDTFYTSQKTDVHELENNIKIVGTPDNTCWIIHKDFIRLMKDNLSLMKDNTLGWGWDLIICGFSHLESRPVIRDYSFTVKHPPSTGYKKEIAEKEMMEMYLHCPEKLKEAIYYIKMSPNKLTKYYGIEPPKEENILIYRT